MMFCPNCGSLMQPVAPSRFKCSSCGYESSSSGSGRVVLGQRIKHKEREKIIVIDDTKRTSNPIVKDVRCPSCGWNEAEYWIMQTRRADEPPTRFYRCTKCGKVWREYE